MPPSRVFASLPGGKRALTVISRGNGQVNVSPSAAITRWKVLTLSALPDDGQSISGWSGTVPEPAFPFP